MENTQNTNLSSKKPEDMVDEIKVADGIYFTDYREQKISSNDIKFTSQTKM